MRASSSQAGSQQIVATLDRLTLAAGLSSLQSRRLAPAQILPAIPQRVGSVESSTLRPAP